MEVKANSQSKEKKNSPIIFSTYLKQSFFLHWLKVFTFIINHWLNDHRLIKTLVSVQIRFHFRNLQPPPTSKSQLIHSHENL